MLNAPSRPRGRGARCRRPSRRPCPSRTIRPRRSTSPRRRHRGRRPPGAPSRRAGSSGASSRRAAARAGRRGRRRSRRAAAGRRGRGRFLEHCERAGPHIVEVRARGMRVEQLERRPLFALVGECVIRVVAVRMDRRGTAKPPRDPQLLEVADVREVPDERRHERRHLRVSSASVNGASSRASAPWRPPTRRRCAPLHRRSPGRSRA